MSPSDELHAERMSSENAGHTHFGSITLGDRPLSDNLFRWRLLNVHKVSQCQVAVLCGMGNDDAAAARHRAANAATSGPPPGVSAEEWGSLSKSEQKRRLKQTEKEMKAAKKKAAKSNVQVAKSKAVVDEGELDPTTYFKNRLAKVKALQACVLSHRSQRELVIPAAKFS